MLLNDCIDKVKTGDLVLFSDNIKVPIVIMIGDRTFSHTGIVIVIDNIPYIYEIVDTINGYKSHKNLGKFKSAIQLTPLSDRIKYYAGNCYIASINNKLSPRQIELFKYIVKNGFDCQFVNYIKWWPFLFSNKLLNKKRFCHEFVAEILHKLNITSIPIKQSKIVLSKKLVSICNGDIYSLPIQIIPDDLLITDNHNINKLPILTYCNNYIKSSELMS